jgi:hypothetical protein
VTADHLWDKEELKASTYEVGTKITDHFEVVAKNPTSIIVRCGDSPRNQDVRGSDGLFEMQAEIKKDEGVAEFGLKSVFYVSGSTSTWLVTASLSKHADDMLTWTQNGLAQPDKEGKPPAPPMDAWIQWLHQQYTKVLMETAVSNCTR